MSESWERDRGFISSETSSGGESRRPAKSKSSSSSPEPDGPNLRPNHSIAMRSRLVTDGTFPASDSVTIESSNNSSTGLRRLSRTHSIVFASTLVYDTLSNTSRELRNRYCRWTLGADAGLRASAHRAGTCRRSLLVTPCGADIRTQHK